jgi:predicted ABC-type ATPase
VPDLFIITGSNGAGKSTVGGSYLPESIQQNYNVFDGDKLFMRYLKRTIKGALH